ncbi:helix-turn-helix transcriptional regulator [Amycolatopsis sp. NPDC049253]|uniref:AraC family transcriptional regulator n=1 Tax=Amycolatopsis sp. NPDC049253 TaxID=3155274 RepID=UPI00343E5062
MRIRHAKVDDAVIERLYSESVAGGTGGEFNHLNNRVVLHVVRRGEWRFTGPRRTSTTVAGGQFVVRLNDPSWTFEVEPRTSATVLQLPVEQLRTHLADRHVIGNAATAEVRLLLAQTRAVEATVDTLTPAGLIAARASLVELAKGVILGSTDCADSQLAPALAQAARDLADALLPDADLSPAVLARHLNVPVRTLHRAFAGSDESAAAYVRRRRLERARADLATGRATVSEAAARWQFSDSSHLIRAFKSRYGQTPTEFVRSAQR